MRERINLNESYVGNWVGACACSEARGKRICGRRPGHEMREREQKFLQLQIERNLKQQIVTTRVS